MKIRFYEKSGLYAKRLWGKSKWSATPNGPWHDSMIDARGDKVRRNLEMQRAVNKLMNETNLNATL